MFLQKDNLNEAVEAVSKGFIIGIPTETVYGIGVDPYSEESRKSMSGKIIKQVFGTNSNAALTKHLMNEGIIPPKQGEDIAALGFVPNFGLSSIKKPLTKKPQKQKTRKLYDLDGTLIKDKSFFKSLIGLS